jgi:lipoate-protein ligase A
MLIIRSDTANPYRNIASEEHLLRNRSENIFFLYINDPSIIVGKHQNTLAEINYGFVRERNIPVLRRLSGGGTVYHDHGNINFSFIQNVEGKNLIDFKKYTAPIIDILSKLGVDARFEGKNDLRVNGLKISGNAEHVFKKRVLHHGTLLFDSNLSVLNEAIRVDLNKYKDKAVKSIRSVVTNIRPLLKKDLTTDEFISFLLEEAAALHPGAENYTFTTEDHQNIRQLMDEKYTTWDWNFGYSPRYVLVNHFDTYNIKVSVEKGTIREVHVSDENGKVCFPQISERLTGVQHNEEDIRTKLKSLPQEIPEEMIYAFL